MNTPAFTEQRDAAIRTALVEHVQREHSTRGRRRTPTTSVLVVAATLLLAASGVTAATATGLITWPLLTQDPLPGGQTAQLASATFEAVGQGDGVVDLFAAPAAATHVSVKFTCLTPDTQYTWGLDPGGNNPGSSCSPSEIGTVSAIAWYDFALPAGTQALYVGADPDAVWTVSWVYLTKTDTDWGVNAKGETFGIPREVGGTPDLVAVVAGNGREGYAYADELSLAEGQQNFRSPEEALRWQEEMTGKRIAVPVYESDGSTMIGEFVIQY